MRRPLPSVIALAVCLCLSAAGDALAQEGRKGTAAPLENGDLTSGGRVRIAWGVSLPLLRIGALRDPKQVARQRAFEKDLELLTGSVGFEARFQPQGPAWRGRNGTQWMSYSAIVLLSLNADLIDASRISLGFSLNFLAETVGVGLAFDLYRGVPIPGPTGTGTEVLSTGFVPMLLDETGEFTVENISFILTLRVDAVVELFDDAEKQEKSSSDRGAP